MNGAEEKMNCYIGAKIILALPRTKEWFDAYKNQKEQSPGSTPGYMVRYPDGYESWSPKDVFEGAYREITNAEKGLI